MSKKVQAVFCKIIIVISLLTTVILYLLMPRCPNCGRKFCFGSCTIVYDDVSSHTVRPNLPKTNQTTTRLCKTKKADMDTYFKDVYFVGDSRTNALKLYNVPEDHIFAEDGLNHEHALTKECVQLDERKITTIPEAVMIIAPKIIIVNFGINGASWLSVDDFIVGYEKLIDTFIDGSPNSIIVIEAVMPVSLSYEQKSDGCSNEKIDEINDALYKMAQRKGLFFLGTNEVMKNKSNDLIDDYHGGDGLHYNEAGYEKIIDYILTHAIIIK